MQHARMEANKKLSTMQTRLPAVGGTHAQLLYLNQQGTVQPQQ